MTPRRSRGRRLVLVAVAAVALVLAACSEVKNNGQNSLEPKGPQAQKIYDLFVPILIIAIVVGIAIIVATVFLAVKFRHKKGTNENPKQVHGNTRLEIGWTVAPRAAPRDHRGADRRHHLRPGREPRARRRCRSPSRASSGGGSSSIPTPRSSPPTRWSSPPGATCSCSSPPATAAGTSKTCNVIHSFWVPELAGKKDVVPGQTNTLTLDGRQARHLPRAVRGVLRPLARQHALPRDRQEPGRLPGVAERAAAGPGERRSTDADGKQVPAGPTQKLIVNTFACTNCHIFDDSSKPAYGPNLTHLASRTTFASGSYPLTASNLINWVQDAPSMIPMSSQDCRLPPGDGICVGMPSFIENTPPGQQSMTQQQAEDIADFLLEQK